MEMYFYFMKHIIKPVDAIVFTIILGLSLHLIRFTVKRIAIGPLIMKIKVWGTDLKTVFKGNYITRKTNYVVGTFFLLMCWGYYHISNMLVFKQYIKVVESYDQDISSYIGLPGTLMIVVLSTLLFLSPALLMLSKRQSLWIGERGFYIQNQFLIWKEVLSIDLDPKYIRIRHLEGLHVYDVDLERDQATEIISALEHHVKIKITVNFNNWRYS